ncbi:MAG: hypothetical protein JST64_12590 [Actinobacteria bacterium]|nr:hypothetical protein [Actinomycetota bacterium]
MPAGELAPVVVLGQSGPEAVDVDPIDTSEAAHVAPVAVDSREVLTETEPPVALDATSVLDRRDALLVPVEKSMTRTLKRLVSDEQNEVLDRLRRIRRGLPDIDALLPDDDAIAFTAALRSDFVDAAAAGARFWAGESADVDADPTGRLDHEVLDGGLELRVGDLLSLRRAHLQRALEHADADGTELAELGDHVRAAYREWRTQSVPQLAGDLAAAGFALGEQVAAGEGTPWRWVADHGGLPCSDAEDNSLAGAIDCGAPFPTGDVVPPAHPGCRCILVPVPR